MAAESNIVNITAICRNGVITACRNWHSNTKPTFLGLMFFHIYAASQILLFHFTFCQIKFRLFPNPIYAIMADKTSGGKRIANLGGGNCGAKVLTGEAMQKFNAIRVSVLFNAICILFINIGFFMFNKLIFFAIELVFDVGFARMRSLL